MSHNHKIIHHPYCLNCHYPLSEFDKNCSQCGQRPTDGKISIHDLLHEFVHTLFHVDGKLFWTLKHLLVPSKLTIEFFKGHHKRYAHPVQLFLVLGALAFGVLNSVASKAEDELAERIERTKSEVIRNKFLMELDSVSKKMSNNSEIQENKRDSLMLKMIYPDGIDSSEGGLKRRLNDIIEKQFDNNSIGIPYQFEENEAAYVAFKDSLIQAILNENADSSKVVLQPKTNNYTKNTRVNRGAKGFITGINNLVLDEMKTNLRTEVSNTNYKRDIKKAIQLKEDSIDLFTINIFGNYSPTNKLRIPTKEIYELTPDSIIQKYHIQGFAAKIQAKQYVKMLKAGNNLVHYFMSKLFIMTFAMIPVLAAVFTLIYRRQKRYYIEHIVFLMHYNTAMFLGLAVSLLIAPYWSTILSLFFFWMAIHFYLSLKWYYHQGWRKTFVKFSIIALIYFIMAILFLAGTAMIGFVLF